MEKKRTAKILLIGALLLAPALIVTKPAFIARAINAGLVTIRAGARSNAPIKSIFAVRFFSMGARRERIAFLEFREAKIQRGHFTSGEPHRALTDASNSERPEATDLLHLGRNAIQ